MYFFLLLAARITGKYHSNVCRCACGKQTPIKTRKNVFASLRQLNEKWEPDLYYAAKNPSKPWNGMRRNGLKNDCISDMEWRGWHLPWIILLRSPSTWYVARIIINCIWLFDCCDECILCKACSIQFYNFAIDCRHANANKLNSR